MSAALDRKDVLKGATVVITTIGVGGRRAWEQDVFVPRKYGIYMPVGDTVGPGGTSRALRMIPDMVDIARDVLDLAPDALFFNYANPMSPVCRGVLKATGAKMVGLCHGTIDTARWIAKLLDVAAGLPVLQRGGHQSPDLVHRAARGRARRHAAPARHRGRSARPVGEGAGSPPGRQTHAAQRQPVRSPR